MTSDTSFKNPLREDGELPLCFFIKRPRNGGPLATADPPILGAPVWQLFEKLPHVARKAANVVFFYDMPTHLYQEKIKKRLLKNSKNLPLSGSTNSWKLHPGNKWGGSLYRHPPHELKKRKVRSWDALIQDLILMARCTFKINKKYAAVLHAINNR